ncbi:macrophage mannose receptor 1-like [Diorhabda sublineata]|uniref:macrophage mannose receptor 1-like n=1 Tax=Diorhabda sublineata TaxID=1163346 RepID=UPI0024E0973B|nr:macrophage mannose receptor 1-like [Diorhabda sublineata]
MLLISIILFAKFYSCVYPPINNITKTMSKILVLFFLCFFTFCQGEDFKEYRKESSSELNSDVNDNYYISKTKETYYEALQICREKSMQLVTIENKRKNRKIARRLENTDEEYWTSGNRIVNYEWAWLKGEPLEYHNWLKDHFYDYSGNCISVSKKNNLTFWKQEKCDDKKRFICENLSEISKECEQEDLVSGTTGKQYYISEDIVTYSKAVEMCQSMCMNLLSIEHEEKNEDVYKALSKAGADKIYWSSGYYKPSQLLWKWINGNTASFFNWNTKEPNNARQNEYCIEIVMKDGKLVWNDEPCEEKRMFICETTVS